MIGELIRKRRKELGLTLEQVGNAVGVSKSTVKKWEDGNIGQMKRDKIAKLASVLNINPLDLLDENKATESTDIPANKMYMIPVFESASAENGTFPHHGILEYAPATIKSNENPENYIWVIARGNNMSPIIDDEDRMLVCKNIGVESGNIAIVFINNDFFAARVEYRKDFIELYSVNPIYPPQKYNLKDKNIQIYGRVVEVSKKV